VDDALGSMDVDCRLVDEVVLTHLHFDHAGNLDLFPKARFHLQESEMAFATGRYMCHRSLRRAYEADDICAMLLLVYGGQVVFHPGDATLAPGITLHRIGGHSNGLMVVRVHTARGDIVLASDAAHYFANVRRGDPFPILFNAGDVLDGYERLLALAGSEDFIIPGHDPVVMEIYPRVGGLDVVSLHEPPRWPNRETAADDP
jgi:glyoxylase-like metal-dependent hydrolase (beta-lactamase superfamily II)